MKLNINKKNVIGTVMPKIENAYTKEFLKQRFPENTDEIIKLLINPPMENDAHLLHDVDDAVAFMAGLDNETYVAVMADYDADGITSGTILSLALGKKFANVKAFIPDRVIDGYGFKRRQVDKALEWAGEHQLVIITCDNGVACFDSIAYAKSLGIPVVVTDHHSIGDLLPDADYIVHPALGSYPFAAICGAFVAYKFGMVFLEAIDALDDADMTSYMHQLAAVATVTDVMPVASDDLETMKVNENRRFLQEGLEMLRSHPDWHFKMMADIGSFDIEHIDETVIGFNIGPAINALGRLYQATIGIDFFLEQDEAKAKRLCSFMFYMNNERKSMTPEQKAVAKTAMHEGAMSCLSFTDDVHHGLVGLIAGAIEREYGKPTGIFSAEEIDGEACYKGSMRSNESVNLYEALTAINEAHPEYFVTFGGHAGAAGVTLKAAHKDDFIKDFDAYCSSHASAPEDESIALKAEEIPAFAADIAKFKPFGNGFAKPQIRFTFFCTSIWLFNKSGHVKLSNFKGQDIWLYGQADAIRKHKAIATGIIPFDSDNKQKLIDEGMDPADAEVEKWEKYSQYKHHYNFSIKAELDWSSFAGKVGEQVSVISFD